MGEFQLSAKPVIRCRCGKVRAMDERDAKRIRKHVAKKKGRDNPVRYYQCSFGGFHWTRMLDKNLALPAPRVCSAEDCGNTFVARPGDSLASYCSAACRRRAARHRNKAKDGARRACTFCGEMYDPSDENQKYCKPKCRESDTMKKYAARHPVTPKTVAKMLGVEGV